MCFLLIVLMRSGVELMLHGVFQTKINCAAVLRSPLPLVLWGQTCVLFKMYSSWHCKHSVTTILVTVLMHRITLYKKKKNKRVEGFRSHITNTARRVYFCTRGIPVPAITAIAHTLTWRYYCHLMRRGSRKHPLFPLLNATGSGSAADSHRLGWSEAAPCSAFDLMIFSDIWIPRLSRFLLSISIFTESDGLCSVPTPQHGVAEVLDRLRN